MGGWRGPAEARFWRHVDKTSDCWIWTASVSTDGYGRFAVTPTVVPLAHRYAWTLANGPIPTGMVVMHSCDNPPCVRLDHLRLGTQADNLADMCAKGRQRSGSLPGEANPGAHLTAIQVAAIRLDTRPQRAVARAYGVGKSSIARIRQGRTWKGTSDADAA